MKKLETLLNIDLGQTFDTPKKLNRSTKTIPANILERLDAGEFTCEMISELAQNYPIFRYRTCITIHGNWGEVGKQRIGGYTNVIQNANGSTEIRYSAIDIQKVETLRAKLRSVKSGFYFHSNSSERYFYTSINTRNAAEYNEAVQKLKPVAERIKGANIYGYLNMFAMQSLYGGVDVILQIHPLSIPQTEIQNFAYLLTGTDAQTWNAKIEAVKEADRLQTLKEEEAHAIYRANQERERLAAEPIFAQGREILQAAGYLKEENTSIEQGKVYVKLSVNGDKPTFTAYAYTKKTTQKKWRVMEARSENLNFDNWGHQRETHLTTNSGYVLPTVKPQPEKPKSYTAPVEGVKVIDYSERAVAVYGNTKPIKDALKAIGARFNPFLTIEGVKQAGWVLPTAQREKLNFITA